MRIAIVEKRAPVNTAKLRDELDKAIADATTAHAYDVLAEANRSILGGEKSGHVYKHGNVEHRASAPGEAPASNTGRLVSSGRVVQAKVGGTRVAAGVIWNVIYAVFLEKGTRRMAARPYARPAIVKLMERGRQRVRDAVAKVMRKST